MHWNTIDTAHLRQSLIVKQLYVPVRLFLVFLKDPAIALAPNTSALLSLALTRVQGRTVKILATSYTC